MKVNGRPDGGLEVIVTARPATPEPTRYQQALRRKAANRARRALGELPAPELLPGSCVPCAGWGVVGRDRKRCSACGGSGDG